MGDCTCSTTAPTLPTPRVAALTEPFDAAFPVPAYPPAEWYTDRPEWLTPETKLSVDEQGRVAGYFYHHGQCLVHDASACPRPSPTGYAAFHQQEVVTASGEPLAVGVIGDVGGHADPYASVVDALAHYSNPAKQLLTVRAYDDDVGGVILGAVLAQVGAERRPLNYGDVALLRRSATSGDWRPMAPAWWEAFGIRQAAVRECEGFDCIGPTLVTRPALPLVRRFTLPGARAAAVLGGVGGIQLDDQENTMDTNVVIDLPNGVTMTIPPALAPPGAHPANTAAADVLARTAASPNGAPPAAAPESPEDEAAETSRMDDLEQRVAQLEDVVRQLIDAVSGSPATTASALPPAAG
jgi:hypothetical protein